MPANLGPSELMILGCVALGVGGLVLIVIPTVLASAWRKVRGVQAEAALKRQMIDRGMSADEIVRVIGRDQEADLPCASEVVVEYEGGWYPAFVLRRAEGRYYIHYVGHDMDSNEWVNEGRVRFPARREEDRRDLAELANGVPRKAPRELEV